MNGTVAQQPIHRLDPVLFLGAPRHVAAERGEPQASTYQQRFHRTPERSLSFRVQKAKAFAESFP